LDDRKLAQAAAGGDQSAFETLVARYRGLIYAIAYRITLNVEDALDVTQNVMVKMVEKIGDFEGRGSLRGWIATIAARESMNHHRRPGRRERAAEPAAIEALIENQGTVEKNARDLLEEKQRRAMVERAMACASPQQRAIFALRFMEGLGPKEIAERLELPAAQVRSQLHRAIARIREAVAKEIV
jgi:RNA polymerase sigma-70 factor (ECF subfamily)